MKKKSLYPYPGCRKIIHYLVMKTFFIFLFLLTLQANANVYSQQVKLNLEVKNGSFKDIINEIGRQSEFSFVYSDWDLPQTGVKDLNFHDASIEEVLNTLLAGTGLSYEITEKTILLKKAPAQQKTAEQAKVVQGKVVDSKGNPLPGVTVIVKGTTLGTSTGADGTFKFEIPNTQGIILQFSFIGMKSQEFTYAGQKEITIKMEEETVEMDAVVVTGMFNRKKEGFTGSAVSVKGEDLKKFSTTNMAKALSIIDPSFRIIENISQGSDPNRLPDLRMRGQATLPTGVGSGSVSTDMVMLQGDYSTYPNQPLLILDGFEIDLQTMVDLDPERVESITLLKDAAATAIYGSKAANGVIVIETKAPLPGDLRITYAGNIRLELPDLSGYDLLNAEEKMMGVIDNLESNLRHIRTGRASGQMLERVQVEYYGAMTPINQMAQISVVEGTQLVIKPYDRSIIKDIAHAIQAANLGLNPQAEADVIRIQVPQLTEDRRKELAKDAQKYGEEAKIAIRNVRRDANDAIKKDKELPEDEQKQTLEESQKLTDKYIKDVDSICEAKKKEILNV